LWTESEAWPNPGKDAFLEVERAGFRFLGMLSHAVHVNGYTPDGHMWCGQRSAQKATDPGIWDNVTAGGLPAGESLAVCAERELWEEAGYRLQAHQQLQGAGRVRISRATPTGWHDEMLHVFNLALPADFLPCNQDGEVQAFSRLMPAEVTAQLASGRFTADAALAIVQGVLGADPQ
jgi:8-oxo-dGTP pyrophosphatase MutT (NUDIX family)